MQVKINCYKAFVKPLLLNRVVSIYVATICNINRIEAIQRRAVRFAFNDFSRYSSVTSMLSTQS